MSRDATAGGTTEGLIIKSLMKKLVPTVTNEFNPYIPSINVKSFPNANLISSNYN